MKKIKIVSIVCATVAAIMFIVFVAVSIADLNHDRNDDLSDERGNMNIDFGKDGAIRNGTEYYTYRVEAGYNGVVSVSISKISGRIDIDIYPTDCKDDTNYKGRDLDSTAFSVVLSETGEYKVRISAKKFVGDYEISWKIDEKK